MRDVIACLWCGALVPDEAGPTHAYMESAPGCWAAFGQVLAREVGDFAAYREMNRLIVDAYAAQHPGIPGPQTRQSVCVHLVSLCLMLERNTGAPFATRAMDTLIRAHKHRFPWLAPPPHLGDVTVLDVLGAGTPAEYQSQARRWAAAVWHAWTPHHAQIRAWADSVELLL